MSRRTPLWLFTATLAALVPLVVVGLLVGVEALAGALSRTTVMALTTSAATSAIAVGGVVGLLSGRISASIGRVRLQALSPTGSGLPSAGWAAPQRWLSASGTRELHTLSAAVTSLHQRLEIADEVSQRARRVADDAGSGVFRLLGGLVAAEEGERGQLAAELHDTVAQSLLAARQQLAEGDTATAAERLDEAEEQVRGLMARTRPPQLRDGDLAQALGLLADDLFRRYGLRVRTTWPSTPRPLPLATAIVTYRFFSEALLNVVKHADVDDADVSLDFADGRLRATVSDAGVGFDPAAVAGVDGRQVGLALLRERARLAGGSVSVTCRGGTCVELVLPVQRRRVRSGLGEMRPLSGATPDSGDGTPASAPSRSQNAVR